MSIKLNSLLTFAAGAALGSVVTWKLLKDEYERRIEMLHEIYAEDADEVYPEEYEEDDSQGNALDEMRTAYNDIVHGAGYTQGYVENKEEDDMPKPYVITPDDFDTLDDYATESLNYYGDKVLTDMSDNIIDYPENIIGDIDPDKHFGEFENDTVFIRNDVTKCDYEILRNTRKYSELRQEE